MKRLFVGLMVPAVFVLVAGCSSARYDMQLLQDTPGETKVPVLTDVEWAAEIDSIASVSASLEKACGDMAAWKTAHKKKGFTSHDTDQVAAILFRFTVGRNMLWSKISRFRHADLQGSDGDNAARALICMFASAAALDRHSGRLVEDCVSDKALVGKLNEGFFNYGLAAGSFDEIFYSVTSPDNIRQLKEVFELLIKELAKPGSAVKRVTNGNPSLGKLLAVANKDYKEGRKSTDRILAKKAFLLPDLANMLRQNALSDSMRTTTAKVSKDMYRFQGWLFNSVSDIKKPGSPSIDFNPRQVAAIKAQLKPGDIILTFTAGYMSNVFLPGKFKHGIVYVGLPEARREINLQSGAMPGISDERIKSVLKDVDYGILPTGYDADVIEAVAEGVKFSSLDYLMKTHVNRMVVLRPKISDAERRDFLLKVFALRGSMYDFDFDFEDATYQCCTEVIYRSLNGKGQIDFPLAQRLAVKTLSADDIIAYHYKTGEKLFDVILLAEENPKSSIHGANVMLESDAKKALKDIMSEKSLLSTTTTSTL